MSSVTDFTLRGDHITLDALLKATQIAQSGGHAKILIAEGQVRLDGETETRRGRKIRAGHRVEVQGCVIQVRQATDADSFTDC